MQTIADLEEVVELFDAILGEFANRNDIVGGLSITIQSGLSNLIELMKSETDTHQDIPMQLFGGVFQCNPLPFHQVTDKQPSNAAELAYHGGMLYAGILDFWLRNHQDPVMLKNFADDIRKLSDHSLQMISGHKVSVSNQISSIEKANHDLLKSAEELNKLQKQSQMLQESHASSFKSVGELKDEIQKFEKSLQDLKSEDSRLKEELKGLRETSRSIDSLKTEVAKLTETDKSINEEKTGILEEINALKTKIEKTKAIVVEARTQQSKGVSDKINEIWKQIPTDELDKIMGKKL